MTILVDSLRRIYRRGRVTKERLQLMVQKGTITEHEYKYITDEHYPKKEE